MERTCREIFSVRNFSTGLERRRCLLTDVTHQHRVLLTSSVAILATLPFTCIGTHFEAHSSTSQTKSAGLLPLSFCNRCPYMPHWTCPQFNIYTFWYACNTVYVHNNELVSHNLGLSQIYASGTLPLIRYFATSHFHTSSASLMITCQDLSRIRCDAHTVAQLVEGTALQPGRLQVRSPDCYRNFSIT